MRRLSIAVIAAVSSITATQVSTAADMAVKGLPPPAPIWSWTGLYLGANAGGSRASTDWLNNHLSTCSAGFTVSGCDDGGQSSNSFIGGGQFGARWQTGRWVVGIEATADYTNFHAITLDPQGAAAGFTIFDETRLRGLYTLTGQAGVAWDRSLWYVKGGWASSRLTQTSNEPSVPIFGSVSHQANGWTVGTGLEYRLTSLPNFSVGLEYDYIKLNAGDTSTCTTPSGNSAFSCPVPTVAPLMFTGFRANISEVLVRGNYSFNWAGGY
jgi:outer membrane immunogenic protein